MSRLRFLAALFILYVAILTGCQRENHALPTSTSLPDAAIPQPSPFPLPSSTPTAAPKPSPTLSPTPVQGILSLKNAAQARALAQLGNGSAIQTAWSADGKTFAVASATGIFLYDTGTFALKHTINVKTRVSSFALSPDNQTIAIGTCSQRIFTAYEWCSQGKIIVVDEQDGSEKFSQTAFLSEVKYLRFSQDGKQLISTGCGQNDPAYGVCSGDQILVWNTDKGILAKSFPPQEGFITSIDFAPGRSVVASARGEKDIRYWDLASNHGRAFITANTIKVSQVAFSTDGKILAASGQAEGAARDSFDYTIGIWDEETGRLLSDIPGQSPDITALAISPDDTTLVAGFSGREDMWITNDLTAHSVTQGTKIAVLHIATKQVRFKLYPSMHTVTQLAFHPSGKIFSAVGSDGIPRVWDIQNGEMLFEGQEYAAALNTLAISADGRFLAAGGYNGWVYLWDLGSHQLTHRFLAFEGNVTALAFSPDGKTLAAASGIWGKSTVKLFQTSTGQEIAGREEPRQWISDLAFSPDGKYFVVGADQFTYVYDYPGLKLTQMVNAQTYVRFNRDGTKMAGVSEDGMLSLFDVQSGKNLFKAQQQIGWSEGIGYDFIHDRLALTAQGDALMMLSGQSETLVGRMDLGPQSRARASDFSPDGAILAAGLEGINPSFVLINPQTLIRLNTIVAHTEAIEDIRFNPDGNLIATCSQDGTVILWGLLP